MFVVGQEVARACNLADAAGAARVYDFGARANGIVGSYGGQRQPNNGDIFGRRGAGGLAL